MILFHSGDGFGYAQPEVLLGDNACIMLTFADLTKTPDPRFRAIYAARKARVEEKQEQEGKDASKE